MPTVLLDDLRHDIRYTRRMLRSNPGFAAIATLILTVGIGATTAIFSVVNATLLWPLAFREPERLMAVFLRMPVQYGSGEIDMVWSYPKYQVFRTANRAFSDAAIHVADSYTVGTEDGAERVLGETVSARYFSILGIVPERGRFFRDSEDRPTDGDRSVVISDAYWRERFGAAPPAVGAALELKGQRYTINDLKPPGFAGVSGNARLWPLYTALQSLQTLQSPTAHQFEVVARLTRRNTTDSSRTPNHCGGAGGRNAAWAAKRSRFDTA
jgi:putative ABC transport system permease protein